MSEAVARKVCYEELLDTFSAWANKQLESTPEALAVALTVLWTDGCKDFPAGSAIGPVLNAPHMQILLMEQQVRCLMASMHNLMQAIQTMKKKLAEQPTQGS